MHCISSNTQRMQLQFTATQISHRLSSTSEHCPVLSQPSRSLSTVMFTHTRLPSCKGRTALQRGRSNVQHIFARATSNPWTQFSRQQPTPEQVQKRTEQLRELVQESIKIAVQTGPRGVFRSLQAGQAVAGLAQDYILRGQLDPPQTVLRKLFERLGATYIKLGQFIASSPSLFPEGGLLASACCYVTALKLGEKHARTPSSTSHSWHRQTLVVMSASVACTVPVQHVCAASSWFAANLVFRQSKQRPSGQRSLHRLHVCILFLQDHSLPIKIILQSTSWNFRSA